MLEQLEVFCFIINKILLNLKLLMITKEGKLEIYNINNKNSWIN